MSKSTKPTSPRSIVELVAALGKVVDLIHCQWIYWEAMMQPEDPAEWAGTLYRRVAPGFFEHAQHALLSQVILGLAKFGDRERIAGRDNLTLSVLTDALPASHRPYVDAAITQATEAVREVTDNPDLRTVRNRVISHNDLDACLGNDIPDVSIEKIRLAVGGLLDLKARIGTAMTGTTFRIDTGEGYGADLSAEDPWRQEVARLNEVLKAGLAPT